MTKHKLGRIIKKYQSAFFLLWTCLMVLTGAILSRSSEVKKAWAWELPRVSYLAYEKESACKTEKCKILSYIVEKFQDDAANAITLVRKCENSSFNQKAVNYNNNGTTDHGIFQVNSIHTKRYGSAFKTDWKANVDVAYEIYKAAGKKFTPWSCAPIINQANYLGEK